MPIRFQNATGRTISGHVGTQSVSIRPGGTYAFPDICSLADYTFETHVSIIDDSSGQVVQSLNRQAESAGCTHRFNSTAVAAPDSSPSDEPGPAGDSAAQQGAPATEPQPTVEQDPQPYGAPGESRQPTEAMHDQTDPRPAGEIREGLVDNGTPPAEADRQVDQARRGEPPDGESRTSHTGDRSTEPSAGGEPVDLFSGAFVMRELDLEVPTPFQPITFERRYRSGKPYFGPFGFNWDHNWNIYLRELNDGGVARWTGMLHEDVFKRTGAGWDPPRGVFELLEPVPGPGVGYLLRGPGGIVREFTRPVGWTDAQRIPLTRIIDRAGNQITLRYDAENRLLHVRDDDGRGLDFLYGECGFLEAVRDQSGREIRYFHDDTREHLVAVRLPATTSDPIGSLVAYEYATPLAHPAQRHNIVRVVAPDGASVTVNEYGQDPSQTNFNRVVRQVQGGYFYEFDYTLLQWLQNDPVFRDVPSFQTTATYPDRSFWTYTFNTAGDLLDERFRLSHDGSFRVVIRKMRYDTQGNLIEEIAPDGARTVWTYDDAAADPRDRPNLLKVERGAAPIFPVASRIVFRADYEPQFQLIRRLRHENGAETRYVYDFDLAPGPGNIGVLRRIDWPDCTLPDGSTQSSSTAFEYNARGQPTALVTPEGARDEIEYFAGAGTKTGFRRSYHADVGGANETTSFDFDAAGFPIAVTAPGGAVTRFAHDAIGRRIAEILPPIGGVSDRTEWEYHWQGTARVIRRPRGDFDDGVIADPFIEERIEVNSLGHVEQRVVGANTGTPRAYHVRTDFRGRPIYVTNPSGVVIRTCFDERGCLLFQTVGEGTPQALTTRFIYDLAGRLVETKYPGVGRSAKLAYDPWGRTATATALNGTRRRTQYNTFDLPDSVELEGSPGDGTPDRVLRRTTMRYDERGRLVATAVWRFTDDPSVAVSLEEIKWYDRDGRCVRRVTPTGATWGYIFDGRGRVESTTDPLGNEERVTYGADGLPARATSSEVGPGGPLVHFVDHVHDARGRLVQTTTNEGQVVTTRFDARNFAVESTGPDGVVTRQLFGLLGEAVQVTIDPGGLGISSSIVPDVDGRPTRYVDPTGETTIVERDLHGRIRQIQLANGRVYRRTFDAAGDLISIEAPDGSRLDFAHDVAGRVTTVNVTPGGGRLAVPAHTFTYDGLDRPVRAAAGAETVIQQFDSLDRLVAEDAGAGVFSRQYDDLSLRYRQLTSDGRRERHEFDDLGRVTRVVLENAGVSPLAAQSAAPGTTLIEATFRGPSRVAALVHASNVRSDWTHDSLGRLIDVVVDNAGGTLERVLYRADEMNRRRLVQFAGPIAAINTAYAFDTRGRLVRSRGGFPFGAAGPAPSLAQATAQIAAADAASVGAPNEVVYALTAADDRANVTRSIGGPAVIDAYTWGAAHELTSVGGSAYTNDADGARVAGNGLTYRYDGLGRLCDVLAGVTPRASFSYDPLGRLVRIATPASTERYRYLGFYRLRVDDNAGIPRTLLAQHPNLRCASHAVTAGGRFDLHFNGHEDLVLITDAAGNAVRRVRYDDFGAPTLLDGAGNPVGSLVTGVVPVFGAMPFVATAGLYLTPKRAYDPATGLFLARDPFLYFSSPNPFVFAQHDPINGIDPSGEIAPLLLAGLIVGAIGAIIGGASVVIRGGDYDVWDVLAGAAIGFGAGFISGVTFGAAAEAIGGVALTGAAAAGATGTATGTAVTAGGLSAGVSVGTGIAAGSLSGLAGGTFSGFAHGSYQYARHGGDYWSMVGDGVVVEGLSGAVGGAVGGGLFAGSLRLGALPAGQGYWASLSGQSTRLTMQEMAPTLLARGMASPYGIGGAAVSGFGGGYSGGVTRRLLTGETVSDAFSDAVTDGYWGAGSSLAGSVLNPTTYVYWRSRFSPTYAARIEQVRGVGAHHQRNVAQYPELATPNLSRTDLTWFERFYGTSIIGGNLRGRFSEYQNRQQHIDLHNLWRFGQRGPWTQVDTHGPWAPATSVYTPPSDPRSTSHVDK